MLLKWLVDMSATIKTRILELLAEFPDGLAMLDLAARLRKNKYRIAEIVRGLDGKAIYVDRWVAADKGKWAAVWCLIPVPANCPKPDRRT